MPENDTAGGCTFGCGYIYTAEPKKALLDLSFDYGKDGKPTAADIRISDDPTAKFITSNPPPTKVENTFRPGGSGFATDVDKVRLNEAMLGKLSPDQLHVLAKYLRRRIVQSTESRATRKERTDARILAPVLTAVQQELLRYPSGRVEEEERQRLNNLLFSGTEHPR